MLKGYHGVGGLVSGRANRAFALRLDATSSRRLSDRHARRLDARDAPLLVALAAHVDETTVGAFRPQDAAFQARADPQTSNDRGRRGPAMVDGKAHEGGPVCDTRGSSSSRGVVGISKVT